MKMYKVEFFFKENYGDVPDYTLKVFYYEDEKIITAENYRFLSFPVIGKDYFSAIRNLSITIVKTNFSKIKIYNDLNDIERIYNSHI